MPDISLLPEEMRKKEEAERSKAASSREELTFHVPSKAGVPPTESGPKPIRPPMPAPSASPKKSGLWSRLFGRRAEPPRPAISGPTSPPPKPTATIAPRPVPSRPPPGDQIPNSKSPILNPRFQAPPALAQAGAPVTPGGGGLRVSLIPQKGGRMPEGGVGRRTILLGLFLSSIVAAVAYGGVWYYARIRRGAALEERARSAAAVSAEQSMATEAVDVRATSRQLAGIRRLLDRRQVWSPFFSWLEAETLPDAAFSQVTTDGEDNVLLLAEARSYAVLAEQIEAFSSSPAVRGVELSGISSSFTAAGGIEGVKLTIRLKLDPNLLRSPSK